MQKRTFVRPSLMVETTSLEKDFNAINRIHNIRQTLCSIVSSRAASSERTGTPHDDAPYDLRGPSLEGTVTSVREPQASAAGRFLLTSQRRAEELMRENHRLELLCVSQEDTVRQLREEIASGRRPQTVDNAAVVSTNRRDPPHRCKTPFLSRRSHAIHPATESADFTEAASSSQFVPVPSRFIEAVQNFVDMATYAFPQLSTGDVYPGHAGSVSRDDTSSNDLDTACTILTFVGNHLSEWDRAARNFTEMVKANTILSETLMDLEENQETWHDALLAIVNKLRVVRAGYRRRAEKKNQQIDALRKKVEFLSAELNEIAEDRTRYMSRCDDLERSLCCCVEKQAAERREKDQWRQEYESVRGELEFVRALVVSKEVPAAENDNTAGQNVEPDALELRTAIDSLTHERDELQKQMETLTSTLQELNERVKSLEAEKTELSEQRSIIQAEVEKNQQIIEKLKSECVSSAADVAKEERSGDRDNAGDVYSSTSGHVKSGLLLVNTSAFLSAQKEMIAVYEENVILSRTLETLLKATEVLPECKAISA